jgi:multiple sugar transport system substrate-binding protein
MIAGGVPPDIALASPIWVPAFVQKGIYTELDSLVERDGYPLEEHFPASVHAFTIKGKLYGMPGLLNPSGVVFNKGLMDKAGIEYPDGSWDWDKYVEVAKALTVVENGRTVQFGTSQQNTLNPLIPFIWMNGGEVFDDDEDPTKCVMTMPETVEAVRWMAELQTVHHVAPTPEQSAEIPNAFVTGKLGMQFFGAAALANMVKSAEEIDWDCTYLPAGKKGLIDFLGSTAQGIPGTSKNRDAAWEVIKYVTGPEGVKYQIEYQWGVPSIIALAEKDFNELPPPPEHRAIFVETIKKARSLPKAPAMLEMYNPIFGKWLGEAMAGRSTPEEACAEIEKGVNEILERERNA